MITTLLRLLQRKRDLVRITATMLAGKCALNSYQSCFRTPEQPARDVQDR